jgi:hypothetical protein
VTTRFALLLLTLALLTAAARAEDVRVKRVAIYVEPYYASSREPDDTPRVNVYKALDRLLASNDAQDIARARDLVKADNENVTPMTLMVLAIRLYDVGLRDDAVFWYYAARNRMITTMRVADMKALADVERAMRDFVALAGPVINGYAFCDIDKQKAIARSAAKWTVDHPYMALLEPKVPALAGDRKENMRKAFNEVMESTAKEQAWLDSMANVDDLKKRRRESGADEKYCWKT